MSTVDVEAGVKKTMIKPGNGQKLRKGQKITVHCTGSLYDKQTKFWSTKDQGQKPFTFQVGIGKVIRGWDVGCLTMEVGETSVLVVDGAKGYGPDGFPAWGITPNATLQFEIEILSAE